MAIDPTRAALLAREYRYSSASDPSIRAAFPGATEITIDTNLDKASADALAVALFAQVSSRKLTAFSFTAEFLLFPDDYLTMPPRFTLSFKRHPASEGSVFTLTSASSDFETGRTQLTVRAT